METGMKTQESQYLLRLTNAQNDMLDILGKKTGRTKAELLREAVNNLLGIYKQVIERDFPNGK